MHLFALEELAEDGNNRPAICTISANIEVVVIVHAGRTTTSEAKQALLGVITCSKRKSITSEKELASTTLHPT